MGKKEGLTYESAKEQLAKTKEDLGAKREELNAWLKEKKLKKNEDHSKNENEKVAKKFSRLTAEIADLETKRQELSTFTKDNKPKKDRVTKYAYPDGASSDDKKKFRQNARASAKRAKVSLADYLADPAKYDKAVEADKAAKETSKAEKAKKKEEKAAAAPAEGEAKKKKKPAEVADATPVKKKKPAVTAAASGD